MSFDEIKCYIAWWVLLKCCFHDLCLLLFMVRIKWKRKVMGLMLYVGIVLTKRSREHVICVNLCMIMVFNFHWWNERITCMEFRKVMKFWCSITAYYRITFSCGLKEKKTETSCMYWCCRMILKWGGLNGKKKLSRKLTHCACLIWRMEVDYLKTEISDCE